MAPQCSMSPPVKTPPPATPPPRVVFPNHHARADQQTLYAWFCRNVLVFLLYSLWIVGVATHCTMWILSAVTLTQTVASLGATPVPYPVQLYLTVFLAYHSYHYIMYRNSPQGEWLAVRQLSRFLLFHYPYFQHNACIFEEREEECLQDHQKPMVKPDERAMFAYHPHGALSCGFTVNGVHSYRYLNSNMRWLVTHNLFWFPLMRDILRWLGFDDVTKPTFTKYLDENRNVALYPGGFEEATIFQRGKHRVFIKHRAGFIKLALQHGYKVHTAYTFGEEDTFHTMHYFLEWRMLLSKFKVPAVLFWGCLRCFFMPRQSVNVTTVVGKAIQMPKIENPTKDDVGKYHTIYIDTLVDLFERNKHKYAIDPTQSLEIF